jgi:hypothetical protein
MDSTIKEMEMAGLLPDAVGWYNIISREREDTVPQSCKPVNGLRTGPLVG